MINEMIINSRDIKSMVISPHVIGDNVDIDKEFIVK